MTPPRPPIPREDLTPDNLRPLRPSSLADVAAKVDALAADMRHHEIAEKDHRELQGRTLVEVKALREIALEHTERFDLADERLDRIAARKEPSKVTL